ncbi:MAG: hypothetical protein Q9195_006398 [Heterodermia aff. obscurata]
MPVTIHPAPGYAARQWNGRTASSPDELLKGACPESHQASKCIIQSSFEFDVETSISPLKNGFVHAAIDAYSYHHHLTLRPEDIWFAILTQLSLYINEHAEELRSFFVAHEGQKELWIIYDSGSIHTVDMGDFAQRMGGLLSKNVNDSELHPWIIPAFSTTTAQDRVVASVIMMGALQKYFAYGCGICCALPSVTLLGEKADWKLGILTLEKENILQRIEKIPNLGEEPRQFYELLKPVLTRFVDSFTSPDSECTRDFWQKIADKNSGSGFTMISGWITAFCFWDQHGKMLYRVGNRSGRPGCLLDDVSYHQVEIKNIPSGCTSVPVTVDDNGKIYKTVMVAGSVGARVTSSGEMLDESHVPHKGQSGRYEAGKWVPDNRKPPPPTGAPGLDSLQPESGWWMYDTFEDPKAAEDKERTMIQDSDSRPYPIEHWNSTKPEARMTVEESRTQRV